MQSSHVPRLECIPEYPVAFVTEDKICALSLVYICDMLPISAQMVIQRH